MLSNLKQGKFRLIRKVIWQVGRTGTVTPVAELNPIQLGGTTVSRATLHNPEEIERKDIREGDTILLEKGGDIIPKIIRVIKEKREPSSRPMTIPEFCPVCNARLISEKDVAAL